MMETPLVSGDVKEAATASRRNDHAGRRRRRLELMRSGSAKRIRAMCEGAPSPIYGLEPKATEADRILGILAASGRIRGRVTGGGVCRHPCLSHGTVSTIGGRAEMEDTVTVAPGFAGATKEVDFFGVFDGHGGTKVSSLCRERMHLIVAEEVVGEEGEEDEEGAKWGKALAASFLKVDREFCAVVGEAGASTTEKMMGSTAVAAVVGRRWIAVANCGDSRAVLSRDGAPVALSSDHKVLYG